MRCLDKKEAENLLTDNFAEAELIAHFKKEYGQISNLFHINYVPSQILNTFMRVGKDVSTDEIYQFEESLSKVANEQNVITAEHKDIGQRIEEASFDDLLKLCKEDLDSIKEKDDA